MSDNIAKAILAAVVCVCGITYGRISERYEWSTSAVRAGVGRFNAKTAAFEWITPKEPKRDCALEVQNEMIMNRLNNQKCDQ